MRGYNLQGHPAYYTDSSFAGFITVVVTWQLGGHIYIPFLDPTMSPQRKDYGWGCFYGSTDGQERQKSHERLTPNASEVCAVRKRYPTEVCWGSQDPQLSFYTEVVGGSELRGIRGPSHPSGSSSALFRGGPPLLSFVRTPGRGGASLFPRHRWPAFLCTLSGTCPTPLLHPQTFQTWVRYLLAQIWEK